MRKDGWKLTKKFQSDSRILLLSYQKLFKPLSNLLLSLTCAYKIQRIYIWQYDSDILVVCLTLGVESRILESPVMWKKFLKTCLLFFWLFRIWSTPCKNCAVWCIKWWKTWYFSAKTNRNLKNTYSPNNLFWIYLRNQENLSVSSVFF